MIKAMSFDAFKGNVIALSRRNKAGHLIPDSDTLYRLWELKLTSEQVVRLHCTKEASKLRHEDVDEYFRSSAREASFPLLQTMLGNYFDD